MKKIITSLFFCLCITAMAGCGKKDEAIEQYQKDMTTFFENLAAYNDEMNAIDASADDAQAVLLGYLDKVRDEVAWMAELEVPEQLSRKEGFAAIEALADEADANMQQAVELYHRAYGEETFNEGVAQAAREYYDRANKRIKIIIMLLHGEIPEGEGITYTEESGILGGGYLNQTDEKDENGASPADPEQDGQSLEGSGQSMEDSGQGMEDNFDTDDTEFYEGP